MRTILVTGGCGFIGSHFVRLILHERPQWKLINIDALTYAGNLDNLADLEATSDPSRYRFIRGDITDCQVVNQLFSSETIDAIVNLAAETHVDRSLLDSALFLRTNVEGTRVLLEAAIRYEVDRFLQVSTDEVYGSLSPLDWPFTERSPLQPNSPYAASKAAADLLVQAYHNSYELPVLITRCGNNYGPYQFPEKFLPLFITNALGDQLLPLYGDGQNIRDWIYVEDHVRALLQVLEHGVSAEVYNIGAGQERSNEWMAELVLDILNKPRSLIRYVDDRPGHDRRYALDITKIKRELGWQPRQSLESGIRQTVNWYLSHPEWVAAVRQQEDYQRWLERNYAARMRINL
jgi:dTDP-glucose 4,6-dehydratase